MSEFDLDAHKNKFQSNRRFTALYKSFLKYFTLTNKTVGTLSRVCPNLFRVDRILILIPSDC